MSEVLASAADAVRLALSSNPLASLVGAAVAAVVLTRARRWVGVAAGWSVLAVVWLLGDGVFVLALLERLQVSGVSATVSGYVSLALGTLGGLAFGYVLPAWAGAFVGRRVTWGTGWLSAIIVSTTVSGLVAALAAGLLGG